jgi:hypothetical protein
MTGHHQLFKAGVQESGRVSPAHGTSDGRSFLAQSCHSAGIYFVSRPPSTLEIVSKQCALHTRTPPFGALTNGRPISKATPYGVSKDNRGANPQFLTRFQTHPTGASQFFKSTYRSNPRYILACHSPTCHRLNQNHQHPMCPPRHFIRHVGINPTPAPTRPTSHTESRYCYQNARRTGCGPNVPCTSVQQRDASLFARASFFRVRADMISALL